MSKRGNPSIRGTDPISVFLLPKRQCSGELKMDEDLLPENQREAYEAFFDSVQLNGILKPKTTVMISIAASMAMGCYP